MCDRSGMPLKVPKFEDYLDAFTPAKPSLGSSEIAKILMERPGLMPSLKE